MSEQIALNNGTDRTKEARMRELIGILNAAAYAYYVEDREYAAGQSHCQRRRGVQSGI